MWERPGGRWMPTCWLCSGALPAVSSLCFQSDASRPGSGGVIDAVFESQAHIQVLAEAQEKFDPEDVRRRV